MKSIGTICGARITRKLSGVVLSLLLALPVALQAQFAFTTNSGTITITRYTGSGGAVIIPDTTNGLPVTSIGGNAFSLSTSLTNVTIPDSITNIESLAFQLCTSLPNVDIPGSVLTIGNNAFLNCKKLTAIIVNSTNSCYSSLDGVLFNKSQTSLVEYPAGKAGSYMIPNTVIAIGDNAFNSCTKLTGVTIPTSVTRIGYFAFEYCGLTNVTMPNSVTNIAQSAFAHCPSLTSATIPGGVSYIGLAAFESCPSLTTISVDATNSFYSSSMDGVLFNKSQTRLIQFPGGKVGGYAISNSVTEIGIYAFDGSVNLTSVTIPNSVTNIESPAFYNCPTLTTITLDPGNLFFSSVDGVLYNRLRTQLIQFPGGRPGTYAVLNTVTQIEGYAFAGCTSLSYITVPASVTNIVAWAFIWSTNLAGVYFQGNAPTIGYDLFDGDNKVTVYYLPWTTGWGPTFGDRPTALWNPQVQVNNGTFGVRTNRFGFTIIGTTNIPIVVDACTNLANPIWFPLQTNSLTSGSLYFSDPQWTNHPARFYRLRWP